MRLLNVPFSFFRSAFCLVLLASILDLFPSHSHFWPSYLALVVSSTILHLFCFAVLVVVVSFLLPRSVVFLFTVWVFSFCGLRFWGA